MKFKDFIYYVLLVIVAGLFLVLSFSYFAQIKVGESGGVDSVSVDLARGEVNSIYSFSYDIPDLVSYDVLEFYLYTLSGSGYCQIVVRDYIAINNNDFISGSLLMFDMSDKLVFFGFSYDLTSYELFGSITGLSLEFTPVDIEGYFYLKGVNYV